MKVLVGIEEHTRLLNEPLFTRLVLPDVPVDVLSLHRGILPGCFQVRRSEVRICFKNFGVTGAKPMQADEPPDGNAMPADARTAAADMRTLLNPQGRREDLRF